MTTFAPRPHTRQRWPTSWGRSALLGAAWGLAPLLLSCGGPEDMTSERACKDVAYAIANTYARCTDDLERGAQAFEIFQDAWTCTLSEDASHAAQDRLYETCIQSALTFDCAQLGERSPADPFWVHSCSPSAFEPRASTAPPRCEGLQQAISARLSQCDAGLQQAPMQGSWQCSRPLEAAPHFDALCTAYISAMDCTQIRTGRADHAAWRDTCGGLLYWQPETRTAGGPP